MIMRRSCASMATTQLCLRHDFYSRRWPTQAPSDMLKSKRINQTISACVLAAAIGGIGPSVDGAGGLGAGSAGSRRGFRRNHFLRAVKPFSVTRKAGRNGPRAASAVIGQTMRFDHVRVVEPDLPRVLQSPLGRDPTAVFGRLEHDPEKWAPVFRERSCLNKRIERDDDSKRSHHALTVEPQEVVLGESESADRRLRFYTTVRPMPVVLVQPDRKFVGATVGCGIGLGVSPFPERGLDEALGLAVGFRRVGLGADVLEAEVAASVAEGEGLIAAAVVGHDADDGDAEAFVISHGRLEEGSGAVDLLVRLDLGEGDARVIVNADVDELPADAAAVDLAGAIAGDAVAAPVEPSEIIAIAVDHLAGRGALIAARRLGRLQVADPV